MKPKMQQAAESPIGLYVHVPFCRSKCGYCDFYSLTQEDKKEAYVQKVVAEISSYRSSNQRADSLFIGGGTPSLLSEKQLECIVEACQKTFSLAGEITMEANPDSVSPAYLKAVHSIGINRLSFGAQSCVNRELQALGRRHDAHQIEEAVIWSKAAGFKNLSLDVMIGIPYQTQKSLDETLQFMTNLSPTHLSCYLLKIEENTPFYRQHVEDLCANEDQTADFYLHTIDFLAAHGYEQYEISNFCRQGMESRHNLKYWRCMEYLGFGVAAHSFYRGKRFFHTNSLSDYLDSPKIEQVADGSGGGIAEEILLRLRLTEGFDLWRLKNENQRENMVQKSRLYCENGLMRLKNDNLSFTPQGFLLSNPILSELLTDL